jgi:hypothetical protein
MSKQHFYLDIESESPSVIVLAERGEPPHRLALLPGPKHLEDRVTSTTFCFYNDPQRDVGAKLALSRKQLCGHNLVIGEVEIYTLSAEAITARYVVVSNPFTLCSGGCTRWIGRIISRPVHEGELSPDIDNTIEKMISEVQQHYPEAATT